MPMPDSEQAWRHSTAWGLRAFGVEPKVSKSGPRLEDPARKDREADR